MFLSLFEFVRPSTRAHETRVRIDDNRSTNEKRRKHEKPPVEGEGAKYRKRSILSRGIYARKINCHATILQKRSFIELPRHALECQVKKAQVPRAIGEIPINEESVQRPVSNVPTTEQYIECWGKQCARARLLVCVSLRGAYVFVSRIYSVGIFPF